MPTDSQRAERALVEDLLARHPDEAADHLESEPVAEAAELLGQVSPKVSMEAFRRLAPATALEILAELEREHGRELLRGLDPPQAGALLSGLTKAQREEILTGLPPSEARELRELMQHPPDSAGTTDGSADRGVSTRDVGGGGACSVALLAAEP